ncbi:MAG: hypothetical protein NT144_07705 [Bacteroidia bacterium]|nr:hypothetical protein [Bacteroidia bacterium]
MKINRNILIKASLAIGLSLVLIGAFFKISHWKGADALMIIGLVATLIYSLTELSTKNNNQIKMQSPNITRDTLINTSFSIGFSITIYEAYLKTYHLHGAVVLLVLGGIATLTFILTALNEIFSSTRIKKSEKIMWTICILLLSYLAGFVYLLSGRKRIIPISE